MRKFYSPPIIAFLLTFAFLYGSIYIGLFSQANLLDIYSKKLQMPLFTGFLTISGFLLSLTAFIVVKMNEGVYQDEKYIEKTVAYKGIDPDYSYTKPLENLAHFLTVSVAMALITSFSQFTIGNISSYHISVLCIALAVGSFGFVLTSCFVVKLNIQEWIRLMKEKKTAEFEKRQQEKLDQEKNNQ